MMRTSEATPQISPDVMARYEAVIGLEVHAQLQTLTKAFCGCSTNFGDAPNSNTCPVCLGLAGRASGAQQKGAGAGAARLAAINCKVQQRSRFARKNYFYPDLPKGYQISMYELPLATGGWLDIEVDGATKRIGITRLHMEDDAGKSLHEGFPDSDRWSYIDFNRCGVPLIEIVSEPDLRTPAEAYAYLNTLKQILEYTEVSDCNMEQGSLRCDANVSVRLRGAPKFGTKAEVKNLNSFRYLSHALEYEIERQIGVLESGGTITQETRLWNVGSGTHRADAFEGIRARLPLFPRPGPAARFGIGSGHSASARRDARAAGRRRSMRFLRDYGITPYDAGVLTASRALADYFEAAVKAGAPAKAAANWIGVELLRRLERRGAGHHRVPAAASSAGGVAQESGKRRNHRGEREKSVREDV